MSKVFKALGDVKQTAWLCLYATVRERLRECFIQMFRKSEISEPCLHLTAW